MILKISNYTETSLHQLIHAVVLDIARFELGNVGVMRPTLPKLGIVR